LPELAELFTDERPSSRAKGASGPAAAGASEAARQLLYDQPNAEENLELSKAISVFLQRVPGESRPGFVPSVMGMM
jgi:hypothetical protein